MIEVFRDKCELLSSQLKALSDLVNNFKVQIILNDLTSAFNRQILNGENHVDDLAWIERIIVLGESFILIDKSKKKNRSYVPCMEKEYVDNYLGLAYKNDIIIAHKDGSVDEIIKKYKSNELDEILIKINKYINEINADIDYFNNTERLSPKYYYGENNKGFDSLNRFNTILDVIKHFKDL